MEKQLSEMTGPELRMELSEVIRKVKSGEMPIAQAQMITNAVGKILKEVRLEMDYCRMIQVKPAMKFLERNSQAA